MQSAQKKPKILNQLLQLQEQQNLTIRLQEQKKISIKRMQALNRFIHIDEKDEYLKEKQQQPQEMPEEDEFCWSPTRKSEKDKYQFQRSTTDKQIIHELDEEYMQDVDNVNQKISKVVSYQDRSSRMVADSGSKNHKQTYNMPEILKSSKHYSYDEKNDNPEIIYWTPVKKPNRQPTYQYSQNLSQRQIPTPQYTQITQLPQPMSPRVSSSSTALSTLSRVSPFGAPSPCMPFSLESYCQTCDLFSNPKMLGQHICYAKLNNKNNIDNALHRIQIMLSSNSLTQLYAFPNMLKTNKVDELRLALKMLAQMKKSEHHHTSYLDIVALKRLINVCEKKISFLEAHK